MNGKISSGEVFVIAVGLVVALFPGVTNALILNTSKNSSLITVMATTVIGIIPVLLMTSISKKIDNESLKEFLLKKYGLLGNVLNVLLIIVAIFILFLNSWLIIDFIISQFLTRTSYYFIAIMLFTIIGWTINKGIETLSRTIFIVFSIMSVVMILLWIFLIPYVDLNNLKPYIDVTKVKIIQSSLIYLVYISMPLFYILDLKHITSDKENFERKIILAYIASTLIVIAFLFFIISVYGINFAAILTYPVYALFKKIQILGFIERIENFAAVQIIVAFYAQSVYLIYYLKENIVNYLKTKNKYIKDMITYIIAIIIPIISIFIFKNYNLVMIVKISPAIISSIAIVIILLFIKSKKKEI